MTFLGFYFLFCLTTAIVSIYEILMPVIRDMVAEDKNAYIAKSPLLYLIHFCVTMLLAPLVFWAVIIPSVGEKYRQGLFNGLTETDSKI